MNKLKKHSKGWVVQTEKKPSRFLGHPYQPVSDAMPSYRGALAVPFKEAAVFSSPEQARSTAKELAQLDEGTFWVVEVERHTRMRLKR